MGTVTPIGMSQNPIIGLKPPLISQSPLMDQPSIVGQMPMISKPMGSMSIIGTPQWVILHNLAAFHQ